MGATFETNGLEGDADLAGPGENPVLLAQREERGRGERWKVWLERAAMGCIAVGIVMLVQGLTLDLFGAGFVVIIVGTLLFIVVSHL